jgi:hypothetical protein
LKAVGLTRKSIARRKFARVRRNSSMISCAHRPARVFPSSEQKGHSDSFKLGVEQILIVFYTSMGWNVAWQYSSTLGNIYGNTLAILFYYYVLHVLLFTSLTNVRVVSPTIWIMERLQVGFISVLHMWT